MDLATLRRRLMALGFSPAAEDAPYGSADRMAIAEALKAGPDLKLEQGDVDDAAERLGVAPPKIWTVWDVEATATPFVDGLPTILPEPHRFSRATGHRFDTSHPKISSRQWNRSLYPASQAARWSMLLDMVGLDVDAGFASASYGGFQILGENYRACGAPSPWAFAWRQSQTEADQLEAFVLFVEANGLKAALQRGDWAAFARGYNGTAYRENKYDQRLAAAYAKRSAAA